MFKNTSVYLIYDNSYRYIVYDFKDLSKPTVTLSGITFVKEKNLWFMDDHTFFTDDDLTLKDIMQVKTSIRYQDTLILMSESKYCKVDMILHFNKECDTNANLITDLFSCPLDLLQRPTLTQSTTANIIIETITNDWSTEANSSSSPNSFITPTNATNNDNLTNESKNNTKPKFTIIYFIIFLVVVVTIIALANTVAFFAIYRMGDDKDEAKDAHKMGDNDDKIRDAPKVSKVTIGTESVKTINSETGSIIPSRKEPSPVNTINTLDSRNQSVVTAGRHLSYGIPALIDNQFLFARQKDVLVLYATQP
ncbi:unnamed protein product [Oppiella nova]|uniref:Uncharacterized protein n=1 Tax=Oppiella nova TaxID=334625 RepID=A0A7R9LLC3_9ACAR|nr:unnamed protein product [Oppiella nova]CAG2164783.1 unnamed protein product [Oppiella nova]